MAKNINENFNEEGFFDKHWHNLSSAIKRKKLIELSKKFPDMVDMQEELEHLDDPHHVPILVIADFNLQSLEARIPDFIAPLYDMYKKTGSFVVPSGTTEEKILEAIQEIDNHLGSN